VDAGASTVRLDPLVCDGRTIVLRPIRAADADLLIEFHDRLSAHTQYLRFFGPKPRLTAREAQYLATTDFESRFAIVACAQEDSEERIVAVGRFDLAGPTAAEAAIVVRDDYQRKGVGTAIFERLIEIARGRGIAAMSGEILAENDQMIGFLRAKDVVVGPAEAGICSVTTTLEKHAGNSPAPKTSGSAWSSTAGHG
jgi:GNAT superfamily N-acetyltransferase